MSITNGTKRNNFIQICQVVISIATGVIVIYLGANDFITILLAGIPISLLGWIVFSKIINYYWKE